MKEGGRQAPEFPISTDPLPVVLSGMTAIFPDVGCVHVKIWDVETERGFQMPRVVWQSFGSFKTYGEDGILCKAVLLPLVVPRCAFLILGALVPS
jgi:hypothetical protein